jgi:uncharacterized membrane protein
MHRSHQHRQGTELPIHAARPHACREIVARRLHGTDAIARKVTLGGILFFGVTALAWMAWLSPVVDTARRMGFSLDWLLRVQRASLGSADSFNIIAAVAVVCGVLFVVWSGYVRHILAARKTDSRKPTGE